MKDILSYHEYFKKDLRVILIVMIILSIIGNLSDIYVLFGRSNHVTIINSINVAINILVLALHYKNKINVKTALAVSIYAVAGNFLISQMIDFPINGSLLFFLRATMFIALMVTISAIGVGKNHSISLSLMFFVFYIFLTIKTQNIYLKDNMVLIFIVFIAYNVINYFFVSNIHKAIEKLQIQNQIITKQKDSLEKSYYKQEETHTILQKKNEELQIAKEKAEESDRLKSSFLANMSHEIRTPMNGILGFATLLKKPSLSNEKQHKYIKAIEQSGKRMLSIINDIIDISRIEAGQTEMNIETTDIYKIADDLFTFFKPEAFDKKLIINLNILDEHKDCIIETDKNKLIQILTNLIKNALKFTQNGKVEFGYKIQGNFVQFFVSDSGIGVPVEMQAKIFERFRQVETNMASKYEGAGLGLSISKAFVELLGGTIWLESEPSKGSTFYFTIPLINPLERGLSGVEKTSENLLKIEGKKTFLIAEDDEPSFIYLSDLIENESIIIKRAYNGKDVISQVAEHPEIDIVLMDIKMPEMDGYQAIKIVKAMRPDLPVIAQTAFVMMNDKKQALSSGFDDYLSKPIQVEELNLIFAKYLI